MQWLSIRVEAFSILCNAENLISGQALILNTLAAAACPKIQFATLYYEEKPWNQLSESVVLI